MKNYPPLFVTFEGIDGSGKTTLSESLNELLLHQGISVQLTSEPTTMSIGVLIRKLLKSNNNNKLDSFTELLLFSADRSMHVSKIQQWLHQKKWVLCDRYVDSTSAYQGEDAKLLETVYTISNVLWDRLKPDMTILLDIDPESSLQRINGREKDYFEHLDFLTKVRKRYLDIAKKEPNRVYLLDGNKNPSELTQKAIDAIELCWLSKLKAMQAKEVES